MAELTEDDVACISSVLAAYATQAAMAMSPPCSPLHALAGTCSGSSAPQPNGVTGLSTSGSAPCGSRR
jgi:hypothetical protein